MWDKFYQAMKNSGGYVAGGAVRSVFAGEAIKDFDIFFENRDAFDDCLEKLAEDGDSPSFTQTETAWTHVDGTGMCYQLICAEFGRPEEVIAKFDFSCCMGAWVDSGFILDPLFMKHCAQRRLVFNANAGFPICSLWRAMKFVRRGWKLPGTEAIKLGLAINHLNIKDRKELKRQLMGIDTLFLKELTDALEQQSDVKYDFLEAVDFIMKFVDSETE